MSSRSARYTNELAIAAVALQADQRVDQARTAEASAQSTADAATQALLDFTAANQSVDPGNELLTLTTTLFDLRVQAGVDDLTPAAQAAIAERITLTESEIARLRPLVAEFATLQRNVDQNRAVLDAVTARRVTADTFRATALSQSLVAVAPPTEVSKLPVMAQAGVVAALLCALLAIVLIRLLERRPQRPATAGSTVAPAGSFDDGSGDDESDRPAGPIGEAAAQPELRVEPAVEPEQQPEPQQQPDSQREAVHAAAPPAITADGIDEQTAGGALDGMPGADADDRRPSGRPASASNRRGKKGARSAAQPRTRSAEPAPAATGNGDHPASVEFDAVDDGVG